MNVTPPSVSADRGDVVSFTCSAEGGPGNQFTWVRRLAEATVVGNTPELTIDGVTIRDGGYYECTVENRAGSGSSTATLRCEHTRNRVLTINALRLCMTLCNALPQCHLSVQLCGL